MQVLNRSFLIMIALLSVPFRSYSSPQDRPFSGKVRVVNETGRALTSAEVTFAYLKSKNGGRRRFNESGIADASGVCKAEGRFFGNIRFSVEMPEFYSSVNAAYYTGSSFSETIKMRPIKMPIPMLAVKDLGLSLPNNQEPRGFDLEAGDWVAPHGRGVVADLTFSAKVMYANEEKFYGLLTVGCPGKANGIQVMKKPGHFSVLQSDYIAPTKGYRPAVQSELSSGKRKFPEFMDAGYYFRIRSNCASNGAEQALYGKIYKEIRFQQISKNSSKIRLSYVYLNLSPGDRNVEFDCTRNVIDSAYKSARSHQFKVERP